MQGLGSRIENIRLELGETMEEFGSRFNTSKGTVNNWEKDRNRPNKTNLKAIAELGNISVQELLYEDHATNKIEVGKRIKNIRINLKETTAEFANNFDPPSSDSLVSRWERGVNLPNSERLKVIADLGGISVDELLYSDTDFRKLQKIKEKIIKAYKLEDINEVFEYLKQIEEIIDDN
jgi:transcriptional regulator with XRE-family HTH domain